MSVEKKVCLTLFVLGLLAAASLLLVPSEQLVPGELPMPPLALRALSALQSFVLILIAVGVGCALSGKVGLGAPAIAAIFQPGEPERVLLRQLLPAILVGLGTTIVLISYAQLSASYFASAAVGGAPGQDLLPLPTKVLYGGIGEELMMRWGLMTALVWAGWRLARRPSATPAGAIWFGIVGSAALFAIGHLPLLFAILDQVAPELIGLVILGNALPGIAFGWLFWRLGLEAAILAHALSHAFVALLTSLN